MRCFQLFAGPSAKWHHVMTEPKDGYGHAGRAGRAGEGVATGGELTQARRLMAAATSSVCWQPCIQGEMLQCCSCLVLYWF